MTTPLLQTKLYIPPPRPEWVSRPRLIERLNAGLHRKLTLISAPAGFGKTTLVSEWLSGCAQPAAWLSLDESDNDLTRFLAYLVTALQTIEASIGQGELSALQSPHPPPIEGILGALINQIAALPDQSVLVLDDYHLIEDPSIHDALAFLIRHLPPGGLHLVIATREDPPLPLARWRARDQLTELRAADLRFTSAEAAEFFNQTMGLAAMGLDLSAEEIAALERRTEGWIAGLQLAALGLQGAIATQGRLGQRAPAVASFVESFTGSHHYVLDYLIEEVLEQQPERVQTFLLQTSILNRLTGSLCDAVTDQDNGQATLELLERANLFIVPLDDERRWYRYHHLFAELLRRRLAQIEPDLLNDLHSRAAAWYEAHGDLSEAIHHAFSGQDLQTATRLIEKGALAALERSDFGFIFRSVDRLPESALERSPWLYVYHSWALLLIGLIEAAGPRLEHTEWLLDAIPDTDEARRREMRGYIAGLKSHLAGWQRDYPAMMAYARQAIDSLPEYHWICGYCAMMMGVGYWGSGDLGAARDVFEKAAAIGRVSGNQRVAVTSATYLGHTLELEGHPRQAAALYQDSLHLAEQGGRRLGLAIYLLIDLARLLYELDQVELAYQYLQEGVKLCQQLSDGRMEKLGHCILVRVYLARGDLASALDSIRRADKAHPGTAPSVDMRGGEYPKVRLWLKQNDLGKVEVWLGENAPDPSQTTHFKTKLIYTMHARALIALSRERPGGTHLDDALGLLEGLLDLAGSNGWGSKVIEILVLQALALAEAGDSDRATSALERALTLAEPEGFIRTFVDEGPPMARLLYEALSRDVAPDYVRQLLAAFPDAEPGQADSPAPQAAPSETQTSRSELIEPLSERELEILQLIAEGLTNPEIAAQLYLSLNTVKAHTRNIYGKLGVHNRTQAVSRARALGLLPVAFGAAARDGL